MDVQQSRFNKRRLAAFAVLILLILILLFLAWWWFFRGSEQDQQVIETEPVQTVDRVVVQTPIVPVQAPVTETPPAISDGEAQVRNLARNFTERYGSWSTDSRYQNLSDLFPRVSDRLRQEFEQTMSSAPEAPQFKGMRTTALNINITKLAGTSAEVTVMAQRVETDVTLMERAYFQEIDLTMIKRGEYWYVDTAVWK